MVQCPDNDLDTLADAIVSSPVKLPFELDNDDKVLVRSTENLKIYLFSDGRKIIKVKK